MVIAPNPQNLLLRSASQKYSNAVVASRSKETQSTGMALGIATRVQSTGGQAAQNPFRNDWRAGRFPVAPLAAALSGRDQVQLAGGTWHVPCPCPPSGSGPLRHQGQRGDPDWEHGTAPLQKDFAIGAGASEADPAKQSFAPSRSTFPFKGKPFLQPHIPLRHVTQASRQSIPW